MLETFNFIFFTVFQSICCVLAVNCVLNSMGNGNRFKQTPCHSGLRLWPVDSDHTMKWCHNVRTGSNFTSLQQGDRFNCWRSAKQVVCWFSSICKRYVRWSEFSDITLTVLLLLSADLCPDFFWNQSCNINVFAPGGLSELFSSSLWGLFESEHHLAL